MEYNIMDKCKNAVFKGFKAVVSSDELVLKWYQ